MIMLRSKITAAIAVTLCAGLASTTLQAQATNIGLLPGGSVCGVAAINNAATVIGNCETSDTDGQQDVAIYELKGSSSPTELPELAVKQPCHAEDIGDDGTIVGSCDDVNGDEQAVAWSPDGSGNYTSTPRALDPYPGATNVPADVEAFVEAVNNKGDTIGVSTDASNRYQAVIWKAGNTKPDVLPDPSTDGLGAITSVLGCQPNALSNANDPIIVGRCIADNNGVVASIAVRWVKGGSGYAVQALGDIGGNHCLANDVNTNGDTVGECLNGSKNPQAVEWPSNSTVATSVITASNSDAIAISEDGTATGIFETDDQHLHAFVGNPLQTAVSDLGTLSGGTDCAAIGIDNADNVAANCTEPGAQGTAAFYNATTKTLVAITLNDTGTSAIALSRTGGHLAGDVTTEDNQLNGFIDLDPSKDVARTALTNKARVKPLACPPTTTPSPVNTNSEFLKTQERLLAGSNSYATYGASRSSYSYSRTSN